MLKQINYLRFIERYVYRNKHAYRYRLRKRVGSCSLCQYFDIKKYYTCYRFFETPYPLEKRFCFVSRKISNCVQLSLFD